MLNKMKVFFVALILCHLVVTNSTASNAYGWSKNKGDPLEPGVNNTGANHHEHSESGIRRAVFVFPRERCYTQFFVKQKPPDGFSNTFSIKYICQQIHPPNNQDLMGFQPFNSKTYYATMFDERTGIAVYSAYVVPYNKVPFLKTFPRPASEWNHDPDIRGRQGSDRLYGQGQNIHRGHLVPAETYSFDSTAIVSTFRYTNAVPQYATFNTGQWKTYEGRVRKFASEVCVGDLYLLTGTSKAVVSLSSSGELKASQEGLTYFPRNEDRAPNIVIPNSMWTAGCCVNRRGVVGAFAAIGNNVKVNQHVHQVKVKKLEEFLDTGEATNTFLAFLKAKIDLFPGAPGCSNDLKQYRFEEGGMNPGWTEFRFG